MSYLYGRFLGQLKEFLDAHGVDTAEFDRTNRPTINKIQNWNINTVQTEMAGFGNANRFVKDSGPRPDKPGQAEKP